MTHRGGYPLILTPETTGTQPTGHEHRHIRRLEEVPFNVCACRSRLARENFFTYLPVHLFTVKVKEANLLYLLSLLLVDVSRPECVRIAGRNESGRAAAWVFRGGRHVSSPRAGRLPHQCPHASACSVSTSAITALGWAPEKVTGSPLPLAG